MRFLSLRIAVLAAAIPCMAVGQTAEPRGLAETIRQVSRHIGEMVVTLEATEVAVTDTLRFEPYQQLEEMFLRDDVVYLMRHGPTDWSKLDEKAVLPTDCANQRIMSEAGARQMRDLGALMASNDIMPSQIVVSEWCRNQQTLENLFLGFDRVEPGLGEDIPVETSSDLNLLLSLEGSTDVTALRERISAWEGNPDRKGPLLLISHYTNIEELTQFRVFEGEILVLDPKRDNQVLGYVRLKSSQPDVGHFADALGSPLMQESEALDMVSRYYEAIGAGDMQELSTLLSDRWVGHGTAANDGVQDIEGFLAEVQTLTEGLEDAEFEVGDVYVVDDVITVLGNITGRHTGDIYGIEATQRDVSFGGIAVHRVEGGQIVESWQMADRLSLLQQIAE
ncbi:MAG: ester cyclase [Pseudomonadota bacterium]